MRVALVGRLVLAWQSKELRLLLVGKANSYLPQSVNLQATAMLPAPNIELNQAKAPLAGSHAIKLNWLSVQNQKIMSANATAAGAKQTNPITKKTTFISCPILCNP